jgi:predicted MPP superfamily phosphohydrolase
MVLHKLVNWVRNETRKGTDPHHLARWVGRNWARLTYAVHVEPTWLEVNHHPIPIAELPPAFAGLRIVQMSDFHGSKQVTPAYLQEAADLAHHQQPDLIVLTGDFVHKGFQHVDRVARILGHLRAPLGVFAVLGNHDFSVRNALGIRRYRHLHRAVADALQRQGIRVLQNESQLLEKHHQKIYLAGVEDLWSRVCDPARAFAGLPRSIPRIVLAHNPCTIEILDGQRCDLMLSGHTHGGQINLPGLGRVTLGPQGKRFAAGLYQHGESLLYVNKGVGFGFRVRYGVRPEVAVFTLQPK